jgi:hypothetical protein
MAAAPRVYIRHPKRRGPKRMSASIRIPRLLLTASIATVLAAGIASTTHAQSAADGNAAQPATPPSSAGDTGATRRERRAATNAKRKESESAKTRSADQSAAKAPTSAATDADKIICRTRKITGSNMAKRTCATVAEWAAAEEQAQESLRKIQGQPITGVQEGVGAR